MIVSAPATFSIRILVCLFAALLIVEQKGVSQQNSPPVRGQAESRRLIVTVTDKNQSPVKMLDANSFSVTNNKVTEEIVEVSQPDTPISIAIVLDLSDSIGTYGGDLSKQVRQTLNALKRFVELSHPSNEYALVGFNEKAVLLRNRFQDSAATLRDLQLISTLKPKGVTSFYDAVQLAVRALSAGAHEKRVIILASDAGDTASKSSFKDTMRVLERTDILVYPIYLYSDDLIGSVVDAEAQAILKEFASVSGGRYIRAEKNSELLNLLAHMAAELRSQYVLRIRSASTPRNKCYEFKVKASAPAGSERKSFNVRSRKAVCDK